jgi:hypothetical protein
MKTYNTTACNHSKINIEDRISPKASGAANYLSHGIYVELRRNKSLEDTKSLVARQRRANRSRFASLWTAIFGALVLVFLFAGSALAFGDSWTEADTSLTPTTGGLSKGPFRMVFPNEQAKNLLLFLIFGEFERDLLSVDYHAQHTVSLRK